jgi:hypothetical protein
MWGLVVDKAALGQVFSEYFDFPCQSSFYQFLRHHNHPGGDTTIGLLVAVVPSGSNWAPHTIYKLEKKLVFAGNV